jgi:hypothetical protein
MDKCLHVRVDVLASDIDICQLGLALKEKQAEVCLILFNPSQLFCLLFDCCDLSLLQLPQPIAREGVIFQQPVCLLANQQQTDSVSEPISEWILGFARPDQEIETIDLSLQWWLLVLLVLLGLLQQLYRVFFALVLPLKSPASRRNNEQNMLERYPELIRFVLCCLVQQYCPWDASNGNFC